MLHHRRSLLSGNRIPLGYGFCNGATRTIQLVHCIKQWITAIIQCGFKPVTICDQRGPNIPAINMLINESNEMRRKQKKKSKNTFIVKNREIIPLFDNVHLQKCFRNNFLTKDVLIDKYKRHSEKQFASWNDIKVAYEMDKFSFLRLRQMPKLTDRHIYPNIIPTMIVKYATQILSRTVANFIDVVLTWNKGTVNTKKREISLPPSAANTSDIVLFFNKLFDSFNRKEDKTCVISVTSNHILFWQYAIKKLHKMEFVQHESHERIRHNTKCLQNWI